MKYIMVVDYNATAYVVGVPDEKVSGFNPGDVSEDSECVVDHPHDFFSHSEVGEPCDSIEEARSSPTELS